MDLCNISKTPSSIVPSGKAVDGATFNESWEYITIVGMIMYLATNSRSGIAYAVH